MTQPTRGSRPDPSAVGETLETINDQLARLFRHADDLLAEWKAYGKAVRGSIDTQVHRLHESIADAVTAAGEDAADRLGRDVGGRLAADIERSLGDRLTALRKQIDALTATAKRANAHAGEPASARGARAGGGTTASATRGPLGIAALIALITANAMLAVLLVMGVGRCGSPSEPAPIERAGGAVEPAAPADATPDVSDARTASDAAVDAPGGPDLGAACTALAEGWDAAAATELTAAASASLCGERADEVAARLADKLAPPPKPAKRGKRKSGGKK